MVIQLHISEPVMDQNFMVGCVWRYRAAYLTVARKQRGRRQRERQRKEKRERNT
jgi:hypothetical protein